MANEKFVYKRDEIINDYKLITSHEFALLPEDIQMAYCDRLYGYYVKKAKETNTKVTKNGYLPKEHAIYLKANGCIGTNYDFAIEEIEFEPVDDKTYVVSQEAKDKLAYYLNIVINAKLSVFESYYMRNAAKEVEAMRNGEEVILNNFNAVNVLRKIRNENIDSINLDLTEEEINTIVEAELVFVLQGIQDGRYPNLPQRFPEQYRSYMQQFKEDLRDGKKRDIPKLVPYNK